MRRHIWGPCGLCAYYVYLLLTVASNAHQYADADQVNGLLFSHHFSAVTDGEHVANKVNRILIACSKVWNEKRVTKYVKIQQNQGCASQDNSGKNCKTYNYLCWDINFIMGAQYKKTNCSPFHRGTTWKINGSVSFRGAGAVGAAL